MLKEDNGKVIEENNALISNGKSAANGSKKDLQGQAKTKGTFLGRTCKGWAQLIVFYIIFYICLAAFWIACLSIFLKTIDPNLPRFYGKGTIIGSNPGVGFQPLLKEDPESTLIRFNTTAESSYDSYVKTLESYLAKYSNVNNTRICTGSESNSDIIQNGRIATTYSEACRFSLDYFEQHGCSSSNKFGYSEGKPCVVLSLNRLIGWKPVNYDENEVPAEIASRYKHGFIAFGCEGIEASDKEYLGKVEYLPDSGIDGRYYPYAVMNNYQQPIAMVKFTNLPKNRLVMVQCRAYAKNIEHDIITRLGMVTFELLLGSS